LDRWVLIHSSNDGKVSNWILVVNAFTILNGHLELMPNPIIIVQVVIVVYPQYKKSIKKIMLKYKNLTSRERVRTTGGRVREMRS
jgi:hypothetical protein